MELNFNRWMDILEHIGVKDGNITSVFTISQDLHITYAHTHSIVKALLEKKLVKITTGARTHEIQLTESGRIASKKVKEFKEAMEG